MTESWIEPNWAAPPKVRALSTTRAGGVSQGVFASLNLGAHVGDEPDAVARNRQWLQSAAGLPATPLWLEQVHGVEVVDAGLAQTTAQPLPADAIVARETGQVCAIMTADCLPVLFASKRGDCVAAAHAGWRGLAAGILARTLSVMDCDPVGVQCWLGPAIGPEAFEVGEEVRQAFVSADASAAACFRSQADRWLADLYGLARQQLLGLGVQAISGGEYCSWSDPGRFFSYRRDGQCGRMASLIWLE
ncbi:MAG: peptidoglycan editing factor PgeF [Nevskiales bacterium]